MPGTQLVLSQLVFALMDGLTQSSSFKKSISPGLCGMLDGDALSG